MTEVGSNGPGQHCKHCEMLGRYHSECKCINAGALAETEEPFSQQLFAQKNKGEKKHLVCVVLKTVTRVQRPLLDSAPDLLPRRQRLTTNLTGFLCSVCCGGIYSGWNIKEVQLINHFFNTLTPSVRRWRHASLIDCVAVAQPKSWQERLLLKQDVFIYFMRGTTALIICLVWCKIK